MIDTCLLAMRLFTLIGFMAFLIGFVIIYLLAAAVLISYLQQNAFWYNYRTNHPDLYRSCIFQNEWGEWKSTERNWICHTKPHFKRHWSHWISG